MSPSQTEPRPCPPEWLARWDSPYLQARLAAEARTQPPPRLPLLDTLAHWTFTLLGLYGRGLHNALNIQLTTQTHTLAQLPRSFHNLRVLHLSDLHLDLHPQLPEAILRTVSQVPADLCVLTGDFRLRTHPDLTACLAALERLAPHLPHPAYAVLGNHDPLALVPHLEALGIRCLINEQTCLQRGQDALYLAGVDDNSQHHTDDWPRALRNIPRPACILGLAHSPAAASEAAALGVSLLLCGHTHGGQICLPGGHPILRTMACPRALHAGPWQQQQMRGYTSRGTGSCGVPLRYHCPPEITLHTLQTPSP